MPAKPLWIALMLLAFPALGARADDAVRHETRTSSRTAAPKVKANAPTDPGRKSATSGKKKASSRPTKAAAAPADKVASAARATKAAAPAKSSASTRSASARDRGAARSTSRQVAAARTKTATRAKDDAQHASARREGPELTRARALLRAVKQDPVRRRYKHEWEKAITALERAAKGRDRGPALLEAARARYALYRFSSDEGDRDQALTLARKASKAGERDATTFIAAVRREAGDDAPARRAVASQATPAPQPKRAAPVRPPSAKPDAAARAHDGAPTGPPAPAKGAPAAAPHGGDEVDEPPDTDPVLDRILAQLAEDPHEGVAEVAAGLSDGSARDRSAPASPRPSPESPAPGPAVTEAPAPAPPRPHDEPSASAQAARGAAPQPPSSAWPPGLAGGMNAPGAEGEDARSGPIRKIVIDAGHGGHDPGAIGPTRVREKDVVLAIAKRLARKLEAQGFEAVLTRDDDRYLALAERTALANAHEGDLFVSIHANAHPRRNREGVETWVLDVSSDRYASRLAARENGIVDDADSPMDVRRILADLDAKVSAQASRRLARVVQQELTSGIRERFGPVRDLGVKSALFYVLLGARMPAVLVEASFISNRAEEQRLASPRFQEEVASALTRAIDAFAAQQARIAAR